MLVRRFSDATVTELHRLRPHILMDAGELGSRNVSVMLAGSSGGRIGGAPLA